jgi:hypothetical protein
MSLRAVLDAGAGLFRITEMKLINRKTGKEVQIGDTLIRKNYKGFKHRFEVLAIGKELIHVRKLGADDQWIYLNVQPESLQLDWVLV